MSFQRQNKSKPVNIWTDGSASRKAGNGGWAFVATHDGEEMEGCGPMDAVTSNQAELEAVVQALEKVNITHHPKRLFVDSRYVVNIANHRLDDWRKHGWTTVLGEPIKNKKWIKRMDRLIREHRRFSSVTFIWVKGHTKHHPLNARADTLASRARKERLNR